MTRYQKYKSTYQKYRLANKGRWKPCPQVVKRWKKANPERVRQHNRKYYWKTVREKSLKTPELRKLAGYAII